MQRCSIPNHNPRTGIPYSYIYGNHLDPEFLSDICTHGVSLTFKNWKRDYPKEYREAERTGNFPDLCPEVFYWKTKDFHVTYDTDDNCVCVLWSRWKILGTKCSPCAPGGCTPTNEGDYEGYCLSPEEFAEEEREDIKKRIYRRAKNGY